VERSNRHPGRRRAGPDGMNPGVRVEYGPRTCDDSSRMPLSEHEQRILRQIEQELSQDPTFVDRARRIPRHRMAWLTVGLVAGVLLTIAGLAVSFWLAFAGFVGVLALGVMLENELRLVGRDKLGNVSINSWLGGNRKRRPE
jgi:Protein of unknown function (DUF3040)